MTICKTHNWYIKKYRRFSKNNDLLDPHRHHAHHDDRGGQAPLPAALIRALFSPRAAEAPTFKYSLHSTTVGQYWELHNGPNTLKNPSTFWEKYRCLGSQYALPGYQTFRATVQSNVFEVETIRKDQ